MTRIVTLEEWAAVTRLELDNLFQMVEEHSPNKLDREEARRWVEDAWVVFHRSLRQGVFETKELVEALEDAHYAVAIGVVI